MFALTPSERRGALVVALLFALGALRDLWVARHPHVDPPLDRTTAFATPGRAGPAAANPDAERSPTEAPRPAGAGGAIDLNRAGAEELDALPGIGPVLARRILEHRARQGPFRRVEELLAVRGIGPKLFARLESRVTVDSVAPAPAPRASGSRAMPRNRTGHDPAVRP